MKSRAVPFTKGNFLLSFLSLAGGQDVTCGPGKTKEKVTLGEGDSSTFHTQAQYGPGVNCKVTYKRKKKAKCDLSFSCEEFEVPNPKAKCSGRGDFFKINKQKYCQTTGPDIPTTKKALKVLFKSNKKSEGGLGGYCTAKCMSEQPTTEANSTSESAGAYNASSGYTQAWLRGPGDVVAHVHEGIELAGGKGFVGAGSKGRKNMVVTG